ncbi:MJ0042-type zinc finger domain-containing protein [Methylobacterium dankookense]|uniref:Zinc finger/thioredoxin putative domain-containing protein n=2 Tax=Methylobacterium dankookense TaxID=560405 RepID=A0A564FUR6_9HYPH|nr:MJ0042-type zinc finger domain-containing protein [Methylobacterium dankookense]VUF11496.1 hypothetical protein MTDSW087_01178 [Methylobacterium dankookense]
MLIVCPTCASAYRVETGRLGMEGRSVRCAACRETWFITPADVLAAHAAELEADGGTAAPDAPSDAAWAEASAAVRSAVGEDVVDNVPAEPPSAPRRRNPQKRVKTSTKRRTLSPALAAGLALLAALPLACLARTSVVRAMPQSAGLYARIGLPVNLRGLEIRDVVAFRNPAEAGRPAELVVEGDLVGLARGSTPVPPLAVELRDEAGTGLRSLQIAAPRASLAAGETARFRASFADPPAKARGLQLRFAETAPAVADPAPPH